MNTRYTLSLALAIVAGQAASANQVSFSGATTIPTASRPGGLALLDIDGDGDRDAVFTTDAPDRLYRLINNAGVLTVGAAIVLPNGAGAGDVAAADFDGDGDTDVAVAYQNFNQVQIFINTAGVLTAGANIATNVTPRGLIVARLDADARIDIACVHRDANAITVMRNGALGWTTTSIVTGAEPYTVAAADMDNDGDLDLVASHHRDRNVGVYTNTAGAFARTATLAVNPTVRPDGIALADFNLDGRVDIATTTDNNGVSFVTLFRATPTGFAAFVDYPTLGANSGAIAALDVDADGDLDVATLNQDSGNVSVLPNTAGAFGSATVLTAGVNPDSFVVGNLGGSAAPDILVSNRDGNTLSFFTNLVTPVAQCDSIDFNGNGLFPEDQDLIDFLAVYAGGNCSTPTCGDIDFNNNGLFPEDNDIISFLRILAGGTCE